MTHPSQPALAKARHIAEHGARILTSEQAKFIRDAIEALEHRQPTPRERAGIQSLGWLVERARRS